MTVITASSATGFSVNSQRDWRLFEGAGGPILCGVMAAGAVQGSRSSKGG
jgi:hypothetical protein